MFKSFDLVVKYCFRLILSSDNGHFLTTQWSYCIVKVLDGIALLRATNYQIDRLDAGYLNYEKYYSS